MQQPDLALQNAQSASPPQRILVKVTFCHQCGQECRRGIGRSSSPSTMVVHLLFSVTSLLSFAPANPHDSRCRSTNERIAGPWRLHCACAEGVRCSEIPRRGRRRLRGGVAGGLFFWDGRTRSIDRWVPSTGTTEPSALHRVSQGGQVSGDVGCRICFWKEESVLIC